MHTFKPLALPSWKFSSAGHIFGAVTRFAIRRRIQISLVVFAMLMVEDVLAGIRPHDIANWHDRHSLLGLALVVGGLALRSWAAGTLTKRSQLTMTGPYALVRNPLYVGSFVMMLGFCQLIDDPENVFFVLGPFAAIYFVKVHDEERVLSSRFGALWQRYAAATPRFFPRRVGSKMLADWTPRRWMLNREYKSLATSVLGLAAIKLWSML